MIRLGYLGEKLASRRLSRNLVVITSTAAPGRRDGDKRKNDDKLAFITIKCPIRRFLLLTRDHGLH